jgi:hypothetical protein
MTASTDYTRLSAAAARHLRSAVTEDDLTRHIVALARRDPGEVVRLARRIELAALHECGRDVVASARGAGL